MKILTNPETINFIIPDSDNKEYEMSVLPVTKKRLKIFNDLTEKNNLRKKENKDSGMEENNINDIYDFLVKQLSFFTGKEESFFDNFNISVIANAVKHITEEMQRPFQMNQMKEKESGESIN